MRSTIVEKKIYSIFFSIFVLEILCTFCILSDLTFSECFFYWTLNRIYYQIDINNDKYEIILISIKNLVDKHCIGTGLRIMTDYKWMNVYFNP